MRGCRRRHSSPSRRSTRSPAPSTALGVDRIRITGGEPLLRRDLPTLDPLARRARRRPRSRADHQRRPAGGTGTRAARGRAAPHHGQPRHARPPPLRDHHALRRARRGHGRNRRRGRRRLRLDQDRHGHHARRQRRRAGRSHRLRPAGGRRGPVHRVHGRRRRDALVDARRRLAPRDARRPRGALRRHHPDRRDLVGARPIDSGCRTAPPSASSRRRRSRSATRATAAGSRRTASG